MKRNKIKAIAVAAKRSLSATELGLLVLSAIVLALILSLSARGQSTRSARSLGMADSYFLLSANSDGALLNPANLALAREKTRSLKLISVAGYAANNAFSLSDYKKYNGEFLDESDKRDILNKIPTEGLLFDAAATAGTMSFSVGTLAINAEVIGGGRGNLSKDPIELALMGNKIGQVVTVAGSDGESWAAASIGLSYARPAGRIFGRDFAVGGTLKYLQGLGYFAATELTAQAVTLASGINGEGGLKTISSTGGSGYAFDLGFAAQGAFAQYGIAVRNMIGRMNWTKEVEHTEYTFHIDNMTIDNADDDTIVVSDEVKSSLVSYTTRPPVEVEVGATRHFGKILTAVSLRQGFTDAVFISKTPRLAAGCEYPLAGLLELRTGMAFGGVDDFSLGLGLGLNFGPVNMDLAYASSAKLQPWDGNGAKLAFSTILEF